MTCEVPSTKTSKLICGNKFDLTLAVRKKQTQLLILINRRTFTARPSHENVSSNKPTMTGMSGEKHRGLNCVSFELYENMLGEVKFLLIP